MNKVDVICLHLVVFVSVGDVFIPQLYQEFVNLREKQKHKKQFALNEIAQTMKFKYIYKKKKNLPFIYLFIFRELGPCWEFAITFSTCISIL